MSERKRTVTRSSACVKRVILSLTCRMITHSYVTIAMPGVVCSADLLQLTPQTQASESHSWDWSVDSGMLSPVSGQNRNQLRSVDSGMLSPVSGQNRNQLRSVDSGMLSPVLGQNRNQLRSVDSGMLSPVSGQNRNQLRSVEAQPIDSAPRNSSWG